MHPSLRPHQEEAVEALRDGNILWGGVGSGKTRTSLAYYVRNHSPKKLLVITTAKKRDSLDWLGEAAKFGIGKEESFHGTITVDSWNNISKYENWKDAFVILDEQRLVGSGSWVRSFLRITKANAWILLTATPGDTWMDYVPVFVANGFYKNKTDFSRRHVIWSYYRNYPKIEGYRGTAVLKRYRDKLLVHMPYVSLADKITEEIRVTYDQDRYSLVIKRRWNLWKEEPIKTTGELFYAMRKVVNEDPSRFLAMRELIAKHPRLIIFYNFDYELEILRELREDVTVAEWNGHKHEPLPDTERWVYLVQYTSGSEGWNCTETNATAFYSLTYSYKTFTQAKGRIDRLDSPWEELHYYVLLSDSPIDRAVNGALHEKKSFNESAYAQKVGL